MKGHLFRLLLQLASVFLLSFIGYLLRPAYVFYQIMLYALIPLFSAFTAYKLVLKGMNPYLSWLLPPVSQTAAGFLASLGIAPDPLPVMLCAMISLVGAAAGDVKVKLRKKGRK